MELENIQTVGLAVLRCHRLQLGVKICDGRP